MSNWDELFTAELVFFFENVTDGTEDYMGVKSLITHLSQKIDFEEVADLVPLWNTYPFTMQVDKAIKYAGMFHASRFIILMVYLAQKYKELEKYGKKENSGN